MDAKPISFTCPRCGLVRSHPQEVAQQYCGACHEFVDGYHQWLRQIALRFAAIRRAEEAQEGKRR